MRWGDFRKSDNIDDRTAGGGMPRGGLPGGGVKLGGGAIVLLVVVGRPAVRRQPTGHDRRGRRAADAAAGRCRRRHAAGCAAGGGKRPEQGVRRPGAGRHRGRLGRGVQGDGHALRSADAGAVQRRRPFRLRPGERGGGSVLLRRRQGRLPRHRVLPAACAALPRPGRLRRCVRHRARGRPPRAEHHRRHASVRCRVAPRRRAHAQCAFGAAGTAGRLLCGRLGVLRQTAQPARGRRPRGRPARRLGGRRRHDPEAVAGLRRYVVPDAFTHGSAEQRMRWFKVGFDSGDLRNCNTFAARAL